MAVGTIVSRITGLIRGLLLVAVLGTTLLGDTFNVANTMPNILYNLIIGGALTAVFVPQIVRATNEADGGSAFISRLVTITVVFLTVSSFCDCNCSGFSGNFCYKLHRTT
jgi:putative peptidoglycan lipid II flippase